MKKNRNIIPLPELLDNSNRYGYETSKKKIWQDLRELARKNRTNPTESEMLMWKELRNKKLGVQFRRQHVIDKFIVDFICIEKRLIIEVDGEIHLNQKQYDAERTEILESLGFNIIRFGNDEIKYSIEKVLTLIKTIIAKSE